MIHERPTTSEEGGRGLGAKNGLRSQKCRIPRQQSVKQLSVNYF